MKKDSIHFSSRSNEWYTPAKIYDPLHEEFNFTLDPCATEASAKCKKFFTKEDDGLKQSWKKNTVFVNPPYGRELKLWIEKAYRESLRKRTIVVMLIPARTDTIAWHEFIFPHAEVRFLKGRVKFLDVDHKERDAAPFPSAVIIFKGGKE